MPRPSTTLLLTSLTVVAAPAARATEPSFVPAWAQGVVWYEIALEPFWNGDRTNPRRGDLRTIYEYADPAAGKPIRWKDFMGERIYAAVRRDDPAANAYAFAATERWVRPVVDGVARPGIDGWRLDLADFIPARFWTEWTARVRALDPDAFLMGECVKPFDKPPAYVGPRGFSSVMNYQWKAAVERFFVSRRARASAFAAELDELLQTYPPESTHALYNLLDSHDTERLASLIVHPEAVKTGDARDFGSPQLNGLTGSFKVRRPDAAGYRRLQLIVTFQMTWVGAPALLYGDEAGMWGAARSFKPMVFADALAGGAAPLDDDGAPVRVEEGVLAHFRELIRLRREHAALRTGAVKILLTDDAREVLAYARTTAEETIVVVLDNGDRPQEVTLEVDGDLRELLGAKRLHAARDGKVVVPVAAGAGTVLRLERRREP